MATPTRVYIVTIGKNDRLVRAAHPSAALMHVARDIAAVKVASQDALIECLEGGIKVESAKDDSPERVALEGGKQLADFEAAAEPA